MASTNPFDLLGDIDNDDPSQLIIAAQQQQQKAALPKKSAAPAQASALQPTQAKMPSKPLPPTQAVREAKNEVGSGRGGRGGGRGSGRGRSSGFYRDASNNENSFNNGVPGGYGAVEDGDSGKPSERGRGSYGGPRGPFRGGRRGGFSNGEVREGDRQRRQFERHSGTGRGETEEFVDTNEKSLSPEKKLGEEDAAAVNKEGAVNEPEEKEPEDKEMTLDEYEKVLEEKRKALQALKTEERKVDLKDFESMQQLSSKKDNNDIFIKLGSEKDKRKETADKEERAKKSVSINEFLKPAEGTKFHGGRGRGRGDRGFRGGFAGGNMMNNMAAPSIEDRGQFPILGAN
ncbi:RGG repeats nuclear RNA binding protein A-like isoform X2 [Magnolia sinica]|uniref:RGG repeats nuclear RNA binding protein A-like isoform X2 n=1 Tax=Magnolia sinica TaxID=86752 RepID=UPI002659C800|nr:RGG repeats nuclear RNA binding protein A-like isoform X2 [Magnolia sinica]